MKYLAVNIRGLRQDHRITLDGLAKLARCSKSLLSKIETGKIIPTLATLSRIAEALRTDAGSLLQKNSEARAVLNLAQAHHGHLVKSDKGYQFFPFALDFADKLIQPFLLSWKRARSSGIGSVMLAMSGCFFWRGRSNFTLAKNVLRWSRTIAFILIPLFLMASNQSQLRPCTWPSLPIRSTN